MRKLVSIIAMLGILAAGPALAATTTTTTWAQFAVSSTQYSSFNLLGAVTPELGLLLPTVFCAVFSQTVCPPDPSQIPSPQAIRQGVEDGVNGDLYGPWSAMQATRRPNTYPSCGDIPTAWAPLVPDVGAPDPVGTVNEPEALAVFYSHAITNAKRVDIYETNIGGFVTSVEILLANGKKANVFSGPDKTPCPGILHIGLSTSGAIIGVVIHTRAIGWEEIDAVGVVH